MPVMDGPWVRHPAFKLSNRLQSQPSTTRFWSMNPSWWLLPRDCSDPSRGKAHRIGPIKSRRNSKCQTTSPIRRDHPHRRNYGWSVGDFAMSWPSKNDCMKKFPEPFCLHGRFFVVFCYIVLYLFRRVLCVCGCCGWDRTMKMVSDTCFCHDTDCVVHDCSFFSLIAAVFFL